MKLKECQRRYRNAKRRAMFWSGIPSFSLTARSSCTRSSRLDEKYELAMCDCRSWEEIISKITGKKVKEYNPKKVFAMKFSKLLGKVTK